MTEPDRRVRRTRRILHEALIELILLKGYERVTVQDILDRADVGRSTFYAHYRDKEALLITSFDDMRAELHSQLDTLADATGSADLRPLATALFEHAYRRQQVYRAMCGRQGGSLVHRHLHQTISALLRDRLRPELTGGPEHTEVVAEFYTSAALGLLTWWVDHDFPHDPAWLARAYGNLAADGIRSALRAPAPTR